MSLKHQPHINEFAKIVVKLREMFATAASRLAAAGMSAGRAGRSYLPVPSDSRDINYNMGLSRGEASLWRGGEAWGAGPAGVWHGREIDNGEDVCIRWQRDN